jgi:hypothetical protein
LVFEAYAGMASTFWQHEDHFTRLIGCTCMQRVQLEFSKYVKEGQVMNNYLHVLALLLKLRMGCDHPFLTMKAQTQVERTVARHDVDDQLRRLYQGHDNDDDDDELPDFVLTTAQQQAKQKRVAKKAPAVVKTMSERLKDLLPADIQARLGRYRQDAHQRLMGETSPVAQCPICLDVGTLSWLVTCAHRFGLGRPSK